MPETTPSRLSLELRHGDDPDLRRRRRIVALSVLGGAMGQLVTLYQTGVVRRLPDPPVGPFDSSRVDAAPYAYSRLRTPDGALMAITYAVTAALAAADGQRRAERRPWLPVALAAKTLYDAWTCAKLAREEWRDTGALCAYCQAATAASFASAALAMPEAARAVRHVARRDRADGRVLPGRAPDRP
jgi:uncharacterized membrane protein